MCLQKKDPCTESVTVRHGDTVMANLTKAENWTFLITPGATFKLSITLVLIDKHKVLVWESYYTAQEGKLFVGPPT